MHRLGFSYSELIDVLELLKQDLRIEIASVFTHLAGADDSQLDNFSQQQISEFDKACLYLQEHISTPFFQHILNSAGAIRFPQMAKDMVRLGIGLYGIDSSKTIQAHLMPVTRFVTHVSQIKQVEIGESVGYGRSFVAKKNTVIATLPVGYADGYYRSLGNLNSRVFINGEYCPVVGNVCMDMIMVDITGLDVSEGDEVELFGEHISVSDLAKVAGTIAYEILAHISTRVPRVYLQN
jgi:alanine racemase